MNYTTHDFIADLDADQRNSAMYVDFIKYAMEYLQDGMTTDDENYWADCFNYSNMTGTCEVCGKVTDYRAGDTGPELCCPEC